MPANRFKSRLAFLTVVNKASGIQHVYSKSTVFTVRPISESETQIVSDGNTNVNPYNVISLQKGIRIYIPILTSALAENIDVVTQTNLVHEVSLTPVTDVGSDIG